MACALCWAGNSDCIHCVRGETHPVRIVACTCDHPADKHDFDLGCQSYAAEDPRASGEFDQCACEWYP